MVDLVGIEPTTSSMPWKRAPSCATGPRFDFNDLDKVAKTTPYQIVPNFWNLSQPQVTPA